jgi:hypothetical protein
VDLRIACKVQVAIPLGELKLKLKMEATFKNLFIISETYTPQDLSVSNHTTLSPILSGTTVPLSKKSFHSYIAQNVATILPGYLKAWRFFAEKRGCLLSL